MKQLDFNTMNNLADSDIWEKMTEKAGHLQTSVA